MGSFNFKERIRALKRWKPYKVQVKIRLRSTDTTLAHRTVEVNGRDRKEACIEAIKLFKADILLEATNSQVIKK